MINYIISTRRIVDGRFIGEPGKPVFLAAPPGEEFAPKHRLKKASAWVKQVRKAAARLPASGISPDGDVLIFVHGYNNTPQSIRQRHEWLQQTLTDEGWGGLVVSFDWPCEEQVLNYYEDRSDAARTARFLVSHGVRLLARGQAKGCQTNVHLLGHSTGAFVIREAFSRAMEQGELYKSTWRVSQVAFIGGDIARSSLAANADEAKPMFSRIMRLTNYSNGYDWVLGVSNAKRLGTRPRIGRQGLPDDAHEKAINVDCSDYFSTLDPKQQNWKTGTWEHSWHIGNPVFARDLAMTLEGRIDRHCISTRRLSHGRLLLQDKPRDACDRLPRKDLRQS